MPVTFPPEDVPNGELLSGLPLPDIRGTMGTFYYFATDLSRYEEGNTEFGGILKRLVFEQDVARTEVVGPPNPIDSAAGAGDSRQGPDARATPIARRVAELQAQEDVRLPMTITWHRAARTATVEIAGESILLEPGRVSRWVDLEFRVNFLVRLHGMAQLLLMDAGSELQLYMSPVNWKPDSPPLPMSSPASFAGDLFERLGPLPHARLGRSDVAAERGPHGRADVHGRSLQGVRRPRRRSSSAASTPATGICWSA